MITRKRQFREPKFCSKCGRPLYSNYSRKVKMCAFCDKLLNHKS